MKKKLLSVVLAAAFATSMVAGCGNSGSTTEAPAADTATEAPADEAAAPAEDKAEADSGAAEAATGDPVTIKTVSMYGGTDPNKVIFDEITQQFMVDYPYITVEDNSATATEEWKATVMADFAVGNEPDVIQFFTDAQANEILATDPFVDIATIKAEYPDYAADILDDAMTAVTNQDGVSRAVPTTGFWEGMFCNKDMFDEYGLEIPTDWDSFVTAVETFTENGVTPIAVSLGAEPHYWLEAMFLSANGTDEYRGVPTAPAGEGWVKAMETFATLRDMGAFNPDTDSIDNAYAVQLFNDKKAAMIMDGSWRVGGVASDNKNVDEVVIVGFPGVEGGKGTSTDIVSGFSSGFYITKKAWDDPAKRDAAVKFVMANTSTESVLKYWNGNGAASVEVGTFEAPDAITQKGIDFFQSATSFSMPVDSRLEPEAWKNIWSNLSKVSVGDSSAQEVLDSALELNAQIAAEKE